MAYLGRKGASAALTSADIPDNSITAAKISPDTIVAADLAPNSVDSSELVDGSVDLSHMSAESVDSDQYVDASIDNAHLADNAVDTAEIADNAVTLAKMAGGTDGNLITYDTSGDPAYVATGTSGHVLTSAGADAVPAFAAIPSSAGLVWLQTVVASADSTLLVGSSSLFTTTYRVYKIFGSNIHASNDGVNGSIRMSTGSAVSSGTLYSYHILSAQDDDAAGPYSGVDADNNQFGLWIGENIGNVAGETTNFEMTIYDAASTDSYTHVTCFNTRSAENTGGFVWGGGRFKSTAAIDGVQFYFSTGTITTGYFNLYGVSHG